MTKLKKECKTIAKNLLPVETLCFTVFLVFLMLKLGGIAPFMAWSWWLITLPLWFLPAIYLSMVLVGLILLIIVYLIYRIYEKFN